MAGRDDFGSNQRNPGGWGGSAGNAGMGGMGGQKASTYNYYGGAGRKNPAIGNWNTGGAQMGRGNQYDVRDPLGNRIGGAMGPTDRFGFNSVMGLGRSPFVRQPQQPAPATPSLLGSPASWTPEPPVTQEDIPAPPAAPQPLSWPPGSMGHPSTWPRTPRQASPAPQGSYTRPPGAAFGYGMSGYGGMGNDFRSNNFSPSSYPGGDGITGADLGGGGWRY